LSETHVTKNKFESFKQQVFKRFDSVATKDELKKVDQKVDRVITALENIQYDLTKLETKADADRRFDLLMQAIDGFLEGLMITWLKRRQPIML
jgi:hypothetical protein